MRYGIYLGLAIAFAVALTIYAGMWLERREEEMEERLYTLYKEDVDFKEYVDRYCTKHEINIFEAFSHRMVRIYAQERMGK